MLLGVKKYMNGILENYIYLCSFFIIYVSISFFLELFLSKYSQSMACENVNRYGNVLGKIIHGTVAV